MTDASLPGPDFVAAPVVPPPGPPATSPPGPPPAGPTVIATASGQVPTAGGGEVIGGGLAPGALAGDWPAKAADAVEMVVETIHEKAVRPLLLVARAIVFGLLVAALALLMAVLLSVALVRLLDVYAFSGRVWISYLVLGGAFTLAGLGAWTRRTARSGS